MTMPHGFGLIMPPGAVLLRHFPRGGSPDLPRNGENGL